MLIEAALDALRAIAEETRLRIVAVLRHGELTVTDLTEILGQSQPRVSRHLRLLVDAGLVAKHREGTWVFFCLVDAGALVNAALDAVDPADPVFTADRDRLAVVRARRADAAREYFERIAPIWDEERSLHAAAATVEAAILDVVGDGPLGRVLDIGTGTGRMLALLGERAERSVGLDTSHSMLSVARANLERLGVQGWELRQGDVHSPPLDRGSFDLVVIHQVLHYLDDPARAIAQAARLVAAGGQLLVVDFAPHRHDFLRAAAHRRLGFTHDQLRDWFDQAGLDCSTIVDVEPPAGDDGLTVTVWLARCAATGSTATATSHHRRHRHRRQDRTRNPTSHHQGRRMKAARMNHHPLAQLARERIVVLDGAMGTEIQTLGLSDEMFRGDRFCDHGHDLSGNNELLTLTQPDAMRDIHLRYLLAGADIVETNTFSANRVSQGDYGTVDHIVELNVVAARLAREAAEEAHGRDGRRRFVAGAVGPTNMTLSLSPKVEDPGYRAITFSALADAYQEQIEALLSGGVDLILVETIFDTLNAKAAIVAARRAMVAAGTQLPLMISGTITDRSGRTLSGQTPAAFWQSIRHAEPLSVGLNCALGAEEMRPHLQELSLIADTLICAYPNAGLPNELGGYDESPATTAAFIEEFADAGLLNIVGGCCGTTPAHVEAMAVAVAGKAPRVVPTRIPRLELSGLEPFALTDDIPFVNVGERTNITGSAKFRRLIKDNEYGEALEVALQQVESGAQIIDVNMDDGLIDGVEAMTRFLNLIAAEPDIARVPVMIDSSKFEVIEAGLQCVQGKPIVNSISMKEGEEAFLQQARTCLDYGAAVIVMAFDEVGQADTVDRKVGIARRAYHLLVDEVGFPPEDIIIDPNIFAVATGIEEHNRYGLDFIEATKQITDELPYVNISGGVSNLSFSFRGNEPVREAMHSVFLLKAIEAGMRLGIVNAGQLAVYEQIDPELRELCEDVVLARRPDATERLLDAAARFAGRRRSCRRSRRPGVALVGRRRVASTTPSSTASPSSSKTTSRRPGPGPIEPSTSSRVR